MPNHLKALIVLALLVCAPAFAQTFQGSISGTVNDASGAVVPGASITATNKSTGLTRETVSGENGAFAFPGMPLGLYTVTVTKQGFAGQKLDNVEVAVSRTTNVTLSLAVAQQTQIVEISADAAPLEITSSTLASVVGPKTVQDLPMNGRDFRQMLKLNPGVSPSSSSVNGMRTSGNNYQIDGADNNDAFHNTSAVNQGGVAGIAGTLLPVEAIDQFSVVTNASADYGRNGGSNVNLVIRSGTNTFHGSAYYFNRNEYFASLTPFQAPGSAKRVVRNDQWGFSAGGPVVRNKLFYFATFEGQEAIAALSLRETHPSTAWVNAARDVLARYGRSVNPVSLNLLNAWPSRFNNLPATTNNLLAADGNNYDSYNGIAKIDYAVNSHNTISARYFGGTGTQTANVNANVPYREYAQVAPSRMHNIAVNWTSTLSPRLVNQVLLGTNYFLQVFNDLDTSFDPIAAGLNTGVTAPNLKGPPSLRIAGFTGASATQPLGRIDTTGHLTDNLSYSLGRHQMKFGFEYRRAHLDVFYDTNKRGTFSFDGTRGPWATEAGLSTQLRALSDFLSGLPTNNNGASIVQGQLQRDYRQNSLDWWFHDNWQVTSKFNFNYGVRYTYHGPLFDTDKSITSFVPGQGFLLATGDTDLYRRDFNNIGPRLGFAYNWLPKTVVRGSYGIFFDVPPLNFIVANTGMPNGGSAGVHANPAGPDPVFTLTRTNVEIRQGELIFPASGVPNNVGAFGIDPNFATPYVQNFNLNVQQQLTPSSVLQVGYVGSLGRKLSLLRSINPVIGGRRRLANQYPTLGSINILENASSSNYNSLQVQFRKTFSRGFAATANYTWAKALDYGSNVRNALPTNSFDLAREYGPMNQDIRHIFTGFVSYELPRFTSRLKVITAGWQVNSLLTIHSGEPLDLLSGTNRSGTLDNRDRVDVIGDHTANIPARASSFASVPWFNTAAFAPAALGTFGNIGRDAFYGPGFGSLDFSVFKNFEILPENRLGAQFRVEIFNITNRANYANPGTTLSAASSFGLITATRNGSSAPGLGFGEPRNVQLALRLYW
jgi:hypothetical protein